MRLLPISVCRPGMRLGRSIYNEEGTVLLCENVELTQPLIQRLSQHGIDFLYINDPRTDDIVIPELLSQQTRTQAMKVIRSHFRKMMEESNRKKTVTGGFIGKDFRQIMSLLIDDLSRHKDAMIMLTTMQVVDHYLFQHSMNVCMYVTLLGISSGYTRDELMTLGLGGMLHDIGKTQVDQNTLKKPDKLTDEEFEIIKDHAGIGFRMLKDEPNIPLLSAHCALQHHERLDGSGYPRRLEAGDIHDFARWVGLADAYDAMTTHRVYRPAMLPHQAMEILYSGAGTLFDPEKIALFRDKIAIYPLGVSVTLNTGESGVVVDLNTSYPHRPIVRILEDADGQELREPHEVDLSKKLNLLIVGVMDGQQEEQFS